MSRPLGPLLLTFLLLSLRTGAQQYDLRTLSIEQGLPSASVYALCEDRDGFLWVGTAQGAARSEGLRFETLGKEQGLGGDDATALYCDPHGRIWMGSGNGAISVWEEGSLRTVRAGARDGTVRALVGDGDDLWWASGGAGVWHLSATGGAQELEGLPTRSVYTLVRDVRGVLLAGTDSGLFAWRGQRWEPALPKALLPASRVRALVADSVGVLVGTPAGFVELDRDLRPLPLAQRALGAYPLVVPDVRIFSLLRARNGDLWLGTPGGLIHISKSAGVPRIATLREANGLGHDFVRCILQDRSGSVWAGTGYGGVSRYTSDAFLHFTERDGLGSRTVSSIHRTPDRYLYIGTMGGGVARWDGIAVRSLGKAEGLDDPFVVSMGEDAAGFLLVGTVAHGLRRLKGDRFEPVELKGAENSRVNSVQLDGEGRCWVGCAQGLYADPGDGHFVKVEGVDHAVHRVYTNGDTLWAATEEGLYVLLTRTLPWRLRRHAQVPGNTLTSLVRDGNNNLWIGTEGHGLYRLHRSALDSIGTDDGLASNAVEQVMLDPDQNVWVGTRRGIDLVELDVLQEQVLDVHHYGADEGFIGIECMRNACMLDADSALWFGTVRGATRYDPRRVLEDPREPLVRLRDLQLFYARPDWKPWCSGMDKRGLPMGLELPHDQNHLTFAFTGVSLAYPEKVRYRYVLEGYDPDWSPITATDRITYSNIPPGDYVFRVMARNGSGVWTEEPVSYAFTIAPPFWQTNTFRFGSASALLLGFFGFVRLRTRRLRKDRERLERTVRERTQELAAEKERSEDLLLNILPEEVAEELKENGRAAAHRFEHCTVLFSDFKGFTSFSSSMDSDTLVSELHHYFGLFDRLCDQHGVEKIKTIGDAYMCAAGVPKPRKHHALDAVLMAFAMLDAVARSNADRRSKGLQEWPVRIGVHSGPVIAGVVGEKKFAYDIWGDTVNLASRMESNGEAGRVNMSGPVYAQVMRFVEVQPRGPIKVKGKGEMQMYFALRLKPEFSADAAGRMPNDALLAALGRH
jgi:class 3 adenylate cyclase/ligand-binding sensor domain-containing protein